MIYGYLQVGSYRIPITKIQLKHPGLLFTAEYVNQTNKWITFPASTTYLLDEKEELLFLERPAEFYETTIGPYGILTITQPVKLTSDGWTEAERAEAKLALRVVRELRGPRPSIRGRK